MIKQLQGKINTLEITSTSQANLPTVATFNPQEACGLHSQIFDYVPGTVNTKRGGLPSMTAKIKRSHFPISKSSSRMGCSSPDLDIPPTVGQGPQSSTPYCASNAAFN